MATSAVQSVSDVVLEIKDLLEGEFVNLSVQGEVSNLSRSSAGHVYFTLSDKNSALSCALFKMDAMRNPIIRKIKDGDQIVIRGPISVYQKRGTFQVIVKKISPIGKGDLKEQFEKLKMKLKAKGFFEEEHKKEIPAYPKKIAVITALQGAALQDFLNIMKRRSIWLDILIIPATVQGDQCPSSVIKAIEKAESVDAIDVIVITRGGGSLEDLWGFNNEDLVKKAFECEIPIISAVGHQVDFSLLDFVSDLRCETPSAAAEILTHHQTLLQDNLKNLGQRLKFKVVEFKSQLETKLYRLNPVNFISNLYQNISNYKIKLNTLNMSQKVDVLGINQYHQQLDDYIQSCSTNISYKLDKLEQTTQQKFSLLNSLNPKNVLSRGYTMVTTKKGKVLTTQKEFATISKDEELSINFADGIGSVKKSE